MHPIFVKLKKEERMLGVQRKRLQGFPSVVTGRPPLDAVCFQEVLLYTFSQVGCVIQTKTGRETKTASACQATPTPGLVLEVQRGPGHPLHYSPQEALLRLSIFPPFREVPEGIPDQHPESLSWGVGGSGVCCKPCLEQEAELGWLDKWKFECQ